MPTYRSIANSSLSDWNIFLISWALSTIVFLAPAMLFGLTVNFMPAAWLFAFQLLMPQSYMLVMVVFLGAIFLSVVIAAAITFCIATARKLYEIVWEGGYRDPDTWCYLTLLAILASLSANAVYTAFTPGYRNLMDFVAFTIYHGFVHLPIALLALVILAVALLAGRGIMALRNRISGTL